MSQRTLRAPFADFRVRVDLRSIPAHLLSARCPLLAGAQLKRGGESEVSAYHRILSRGGGKEGAHQRTGLDNLAVTEYRRQSTHFREVPFSKFKSFTSPSSCRYRKCHNIIVTMDFCLNIKPRDDENVGMCALFQ